jgi:osmotically-inducible protein OsmY
MSMTSDEIIVEEVRARLERDDRIPHPAEVAVSARSGTVKLRGSVGSFAQRRAAIELAEAVPRVRGVEEELRVDLRDHWQDDEIRGVAIQALMTNPNVPEERIEVTVAEAWLTLKGEVKLQSESNAAFETVSHIPGVGGITNKIAVITAGIDG